MSKLIQKVRGRRYETEAEQFFREAYPLRLARLAIGALFAGDIAAAVTGISAIG